jgi:alpha-L-fucosidase
MNILDGSRKIVPFMEKNFKPNFTYQEFAPQFTAEFYDPVAWADLFVRSGAK